MKLSVSIPVLNEENSLEPLYARLRAALVDLVDEYELIFVDDGSTDRSLAIMRGLAERDGNVRYISFSRNFGHELATSAALDACTGDALVLIDADLQDPPEVIAELVQRWRQGAHVVYARRRRRAGETWPKRLSAFLFYRVLDRLTDVHIPADTGDFRLMDRKVVEALRQCRENPRFVRGLVSWVGFRQEEVLYDRAARRAGITKYNAVKLMRLSWHALCSFSLVPLQLTTWIGILVTLGSFLKGMHVLAQQLFWGIEIPGYALQTVGIFFLGGVQLIMLGILAQYIGHIFRFTQNRPLYIVAERGGWTDDGARPTLDA